MCEGRECVCVLLCASYESIGVHVGGIECARVCALRCVYVDESCEWARKVLCAKLIIDSDCFDGPATILHLVPIIFPIVEF